MLWWMWACVSLQQSQEFQQPDVVLVVVDTLRADRLSVHGNQRAVTPNMDSIAQQGVWYSRAFAQSGWTLPSFVSLFTGLYPHEHRVGRAPEKEEEFGSLPDQVDTLAESFQRGGYATGAVINNTFLAPEFGVHQGFEDYFYQGADNQNFRSAVATNQQALDWLKKTQKPAFLVVHYMESHMDLNPPASARGRFASIKDPKVEVPFRTPAARQMTLEPASRTPEKLRYIMDLYDEEVLAVDQAIGQLIEGIKKRGKWKNTYFVITSDHGEEFWEHDEFEHGHSLMGILTHIPLVAKGPGLDNIGESSLLVEHVDLFHSLLAAARVQIPEKARGEDIFAMARKGMKDVERWSVSENTLYHEPELSIVTPRHRLVINQKTNKGVVWELDEKGWETRRVPNDQQQQVATPLLRALTALRGHLKPIENIPGPKIPTQDVFQQLKALGYIDGEKPKPQK